MGKSKLVIFAALLSIPFTAKANMIWPSVYIVGQYYTWYVIIIGLLIEFLAIKCFLKCSWKKSALIAVTINVISAIIGFLLIPISGIAVEFLTLPFGGGTFQLSHWILDYIAAALCNVIIEGLALRLIFKYSFRQNFWWLLVANAISVIICVFVPMSNL